MVAEGNSIQQNDPALVEWAARISLDQIPGLLLVLASRWLVETTEKANEQDSKTGSPPNLVTAGELARYLNLPGVLGAHRGETRSNTKRQARQIRTVQIERRRTNARSKGPTNAVNGPFSCHSAGVDV